ncbi:hypothetical protein [Treponema parvum]|uniref:hypothetical protein n=1 Tax=Treponema parvum TaxID=138851 RepID=UPI001AEC19F4|nr:hypothetical protein [Treponema parvum]QTQ17011.1 hypothetical protein HXT04_10065 [Treponema parvum]
MLRCKTTILKILGVSKNPLLAIFFYVLHTVSAQNFSEQAGKADAMSLSGTSSIASPSQDNAWYVPGKTNIKDILSEQYEQDARSSSPALSERQDPQDSKEDLSNSDDDKDEIITAFDFIKLNEEGLLSNTQELFSGKNADLPEIIYKFREIKKDAASLFKKENKSNILNISSDASVLRFIVNGKDIYPSCRSIYFSRIERNKPFLLAGDRLYDQGNKPYSETFYFLFVPAGRSGGQEVYSVKAAVLQNNINENSELYDLAAIKDLYAFKTGSFVSIHSGINDKDVNGSDYRLSKKEPDGEALLLSTARQAGMDPGHTGAAESGGAGGLSASSSLNSGSNEKVAIDFLMVIRNHLAMVNNKEDALEFSCLTN